MSTASPTSTVRDYVSLLKPGVMSLVVFTGAIGMLLAPGSIHPFLALVAIGCIALGSGASGAVNMWYDRDIDAIMKRTQKRPIPAGRVAASEGLAFGVWMGGASVVIMGLATNWVAASLLAAAIAFYLGIYTHWLKRRTPQNIVIGGAAGAFPPLIGWAAVTGDITWFPVLLFLIIFLWTPPHFWALALYRNEDYTRAGVPMLPVVAGERSTKLHILGYSLVLVTFSLVPSVLHYTSITYTLAAALLGLRFLQLAMEVWRDETHTSAKQLFGYSILYLFLLFAALGIDKYVKFAFTV